MGQEEAKDPIMARLMKAGCGARPTNGATRDETGAWVPSHEWWSLQQEVELCHGHEVIDGFISLSK
jgi:hypothetical protein